MEEPSFVDHTLHRLQSVHRLFFLIEAHAIAIPLSSSTKCSATSIILLHKESTKRCQVSSAFDEQTKATQAPKERAAMEQPFQPVSSGCFKHELPT